MPQGGTSSQGLSVVKLITWLQLESFLFAMVDGTLGVWGWGEIRSCGFCFFLLVFLAPKKKIFFLKPKAWSFYLFGYKRLSFLLKAMKTHSAM